MYLALLSLHNLLRWLVILFGLIAVIRAFSGWLGRRPWGRSDDRSGMLFTVALDIQVLAGLLLYFAASPITLSALSDFGRAMSNAATRYFAVEHSLTMLVALAVAHISRAQSRRAGPEPAKHRRAAIGFTLAMALILAAIPWPFLSIGRPLLRLLGLEIG